MELKSDLVATIYLDKKLDNGNQGRTKHWSSAARSRAAWKKAVDGCWIKMKNGNELHPDDYLECANHSPSQSRTGLVVTRHLGKGERLWDMDSVLRSSAKELIDSIVEAGYIKDDSPKYVAWVVGLQDDSNRAAGPYTTVEIHEVIE